jgi:hypothetical protein
MHFALVCFPAILIGLAFIVWAIQRLLGKNDHPFWG